MINLLQISDLHFGSKFNNATSALIPGYTAHDISLCRALDQFVDEDVRDLASVCEDEELPIIMNGDLTSGGQEREFEVANTYLYSRHVLVGGSRTQRIGLGMRPEDLHAVPGNHDHWEGIRIWPNQQGYSRRIYDRFVQPPPYVSQSICKDGIELRIFAIDSCTMFEETRLNRAPLANGGFSRRHKFQFRQIVRNTMMSPLSAGCSARAGVIVCHHPFARDGSAGPLRNQCANWLCRIAATFGIRMIFTGHTHYSWTSLLAADTKSELGVVNVREVRCPTTLQHPAKLDARRRKPGMWLHQISLDRDEIVWRGTLILFAGDSFKIPTKQSDEAARVGWFEERIPSIAQRTLD